MRTSTLLIAIAAAIAVPSAARADARLGLGAAAGGEAAGLSADLDLGPVILEATIDASRGQDSSLSWGHTFESIGALARVAHDGRVSLYAGLRVDHFDIFPAPPGDAGFVLPEVGVPLRIQIDLTPWLSIDAEDALVVSHVEQTSTRYVELGAPSLGFTVWF